jgi:uncharacterized protein DUF547
MSLERFQRNIAVCQRERIQQMDEFRYLGEALMLKISRTSPLPGPKKARARWPELCTWMGFLVPLALMLALTTWATTYHAAAAESVDHSAWNSLLKTYVKPGADGLNRVDYVAFKKNGHAALKAYLTGLQSVDPNGLAPAEQFAFYVNLYNAKTIDIVLDHYPVKSIKDISLGGRLLASLTGGPWKAKVVKINGSELSLDDIEHGILRAQFKDPRVHYAVNCASVGCPNLSTEAYTGAKLNAQLDASARSYVNSPRGFRFDGQALVASSIYKWFKDDFGGNDQGILRHALKYAEPDLGAKLKTAQSISRFEYDWTLNDSKR